MTESKYFTRILDKKQVRVCIDQLEEVAGRKFRPNLSDPVFKIHAPDGDMVMSGAQIGGGMFSCRFHKEVFNEEVTAK
jgi:hypothetical protein